MELHGVVVGRTVVLDDAAALPVDGTPVTVRWEKAVSGTNGIHVRAAEVVVRIEPDPAVVARLNELMGPPDAAPPADDGSARDRLLALSGTLSLPADYFNDADRERIGIPKR